MIATILCVLNPCTAKERLNTDLARIGVPTLVVHGDADCILPLAATAQAFVDGLGLTRYALYLFDYGAPVGFRLAVAHPERVTVIVSQNGNAYEDGLGGAWDPIRRYWAEPTASLSHPGPKRTAATILMPLSSCLTRGILLSKRTWIRLPGQSTAC
jgi:pimeloyl-ACP methyl ester carboxylesterase